MLKVIPIDSNLLSNPDLTAAINSFINANIGETKQTDKAWAVYSTDGEAVRVLGFAACNIGNRIADVPYYHIAEGVTRPERVDGMKAQELLFARVTGFIADALGGGTEVFFHISPEAQEHWKEFRNRVNMRNANRFAMEV